MFNVKEFHEALLSKEEEAVAVASKPAKELSGNLQKKLDRKLKRKAKR